MLLPFIKLPFTNVHNADMPQGYLVNNRGNPSLKPELYKSSFKNKLRKVFSGTGLLMKVLDEQQEAKVSKGQWDTEPQKTEKMETLGELEEEESPEVRTAPVTQNLGFYSV